MMLRSIRWSIQAWHGALLVAIIAGFGFTAHRLAKAERMRTVDQALQAELAFLSVVIPPPDDNRGGQGPGPNLDRGRPRGPEPDFRSEPRRGPEPPPGGPPGTRLPPREINGPGPVVGRPDYYYLVWLSDGSEQTRSANAPADMAKPQVEPGQRYAVRTVGQQREAYRITTLGRCLLVGRSIAPEQAALRRLAWYLAAAGAGVLAIGLLGGWWVATRAMRPIEDISATAERISAGDLSQRIPGSDASNELGRLAVVLNSTFSRLEAAFAQQARFTADAAHELRTPVSVILTHAQNGLASAPLGEEPREAFEACQRAAQRMRRLLESLLELARLDAGQDSMKHTPFDLAELTREIVELVEPLAEPRGVTLQLNLAPVKTVGDGVRIAQVITNLLTNAIEYNSDGGQVRVTTAATDGAVQLRVSDSGPGIAPGDLPHVFDRFYRADSARSATSHTGLGLAISKAIVEAHGGVLEAASEPGNGATFTMKLPAAGQG